MLLLLDLIRWLGSGGVPIEVETPKDEEAQRIETPTVTAGELAKRFAPDRGYNPPKIFHPTTI